MTWIAVLTTVGGIVALTVVFYWLLMFCTRAARRSTRELCELVYGPPGGTGEKARHRPLTPEGV